MAIRCNVVGPYDTQIRIITKCNENYDDQRRRTRANTHPADFYKEFTPRSAIHSFYCSAYATVNQSWCGNSAHSALRLNKEVLSGNHTKPYSFINILLRKVDVFDIILLHQLWEKRIAQSIDKYAYKTSQ